MWRFTCIHPSGLPLARHRWMEQQLLRLLPWASHPAVTRDARQGGDGPGTARMDTGPGHVFNKGTSKQRDHSQRATSRRTPPLVIEPDEGARGAGAVTREGAGQPAAAAVSVPSGQVTVTPGATI